MTSPNRLQQLHDELLTDLASTIDIEAGLAEALQHARHDDVTGNLADELDVEAGLEDALQHLPNDADEDTEYVINESVLHTESSHVSIAVVEDATNPESLKSMPSEDIWAILELIRRLNGLASDTCDPLVVDCEVLLSGLLDGIVERSITREEAVLLILKTRVRTKEIVDAAWVETLSRCEPAKRSLTVTLKKALQKKLKALQSDVIQIFDASNTGAHTRNP